MEIKNRMFNLFDSCMHKLPCTIHVKPIIRKTLIVLFYWGSIVNAFVFMFLYVTLYYGYDIFGLKQLVQNF